MQSIGKVAATAVELFALTLLCGVAFDAHCAASNSVEGRLLVKTKAHAAEATIQSLFTTHGAHQAAVIKPIEVRIVNVPPARRAVIMEALNRDPNIEFAEPDRMIPPEAVPDDTYYAFEWHLPKISAPAAWDLTTGTNELIIAILDSGLDSSHPDLAPVLVPGWNFFDNNANTSDVTGHGTPVAGAAGAVGNNGQGVAGITWGCRIMPVRICDTNGYASLSTIASGLTWAADHGARVANISFRASSGSTITSAAQYFQSKGGVVTVSAGNNAIFDSSPDNPYVLTVSATDANDALASFSNTGNNVDLAAPGVNIMTTATGGDYGSGTGTSFSAPVLAGVAALVLSANPGLTGAQAQDIIKQSADDLGAPGWDPSYGWGRVNALKAVLAAIASSGGNTNPPPDIIPPNATITAPTAGSVVSGSATINVSATDNVAVTQVECYINGVPAGTNTTGSFSWDTTAYPNGLYSLQARAHDAAGNVGTSETTSVSVQNTTPDVTAPVAQITSPAAGSTVSGSVNVGVTATDDMGVTLVEWYLNGALMSSSASSSASFSWNTTAYVNGSYTLQARAYDAAGNVGDSVSCTVSVQNVVPDVTAPAVQITSPSNGAVISGKSTQVSVLATDNVGVTRVDLLVDGKFFATSSLATPVFTWNTTKVSRGSHTLQAVAYDAAGNSTRSATVSVHK